MHQNISLVQRSEGLAVIFYVCTSKINFKNMAKILVVDDERAIRNTLKDILTYEKYEVDEAANAPEALEKYRPRCTM